jgi:APA family basic amino acid/polyamine antiporter
MGLGAMIGTGVFVSIGLGAGIAGPAVLLALCLAAVVAMCNGLSSAQLAAAHPVSGGTYEYGYRYLHPLAGFTAGWVFLAAKAASAATAALGFAGYLLNAAGKPPTLLVPVALAVLAAIASVVLAGLRSSNVVNGAMVLVTILALLWFIAAGTSSFDAAHFNPLFEAPAGKTGSSAFLEATALMFVAYTGYARIATLGEEVVNPTRTIPLAIVASAVIAMLLYVAVTFVAIGVAGSAVLLAATETDAAPLAVIARRFAVPGSGSVLAIGALTAMLGVLLNLLLGLSRVVLAMARRGDVPGVLATLNGRGTTPYFAVAAVTALTAALIAVGDIRTTWSFSAFSVLIYYSLTNLAALRMPHALRRYPRWIAALGLIACLGLAFWVEPSVWVAGVGTIVLGLAWYAVAQVARRRTA